MIFHETGLEGVLVVEPEPRRDDRGSFARVWCAREFAARGVDVAWAQANVGSSASRGTLRGLHHQLPPSAETKLVRCTRGALFDVVVDVRDASPTFGRWYGTELSEDNRLSVLVPEGCAHGYLTVRDDTEIAYLTSAFYAPELERGVHYADPLVAIDWPEPIRVVSDRDERWPMLEPPSPATVPA